MNTDVLPLIAVLIGVLIPVAGLAAATVELNENRRSDDAHEEVSKSTAEPQRDHQSR